MEGESYLGWYNAFLLRTYSVLVQVQFFGLSLVNYRFKDAVDSGTETSGRTDIVFIVQKFKVS